MPEGHLLHRFAREQHRDLASHVLGVCSPQGRFDGAPVDQHRLRAVEAFGKHLLYSFDEDDRGADGGPEAGGEGLHVHVHLGMRGIFLRHPDPATAPRASVRLRLRGPVAYDLIAPTTCELLTSGGVQALVGGLGPDPLRDDADDVVAVERLRGFTGPVGAALLDQSVWAGVGNAWRAELLYLAGLDPRIPARSLSQQAAEQLWALTRSLMALGREAGQVVSDPEAPDERWVYKRRTCRACAAPVRVFRVGGREAHACTAEQLGEA